ncbi:MAG: invasion associated locus B family protein, partial [Erythrobacter sp.]
PAPSRLSRDFKPFATIGTWPRRNLRGQVHFRLSRKLAPSSAITLSVGGKRFRLTGGGGDAWAADRTMDAAIVAAMRSASRMTIRATDARGRRFSNTYSLAGAATAMDAATLACARR